MAEIVKWEVETWDKAKNRQWISVEAATAERARDLAQTEGDVETVGRIRRV